FLLEDAQIPVVLTQAHLLDRLSLASVELICVERDTIGIGASQDAQYSSNKRGNPAYPVQPDNLAYLIYTSGSTGKPKGVVNSHRAICNRLSWMQQTYQLTPRDRVLQKTPFSFDVSVWEFFLPLAAGAHL